MNIKKPTFKHICLMHMQQLTNFPYIEKDFDALTDYGLLCKIVEYLNEVIKNNNIQNEAINELYNAFVSVKNYIDNYFENLDVQDEINNKLDEMAISGQLTDIIAQYLGLAGMITFDTVADMKLAENIVNGSKCKTLGFHSVNDVGGAYYKIRTITNDDVVDEMTIISLNNQSLIAELIKNDMMPIESFGAYGDGIHDDSDSIIKACSLGITVIFGNKTYLANKQIVISSSCKLLGSSIRRDSNRYYIDFSNSIDNDCFIFNVKGIIFENINLKGDRTKSIGVTLSNTSRFTFKNCGFYYFNKAILTNRAWSTSFYDCVFEYCETCVEFNGVNTSFLFNGTIFYSSINGIISNQELDYSNIVGGGFDHVDNCISLRNGSYANNITLLNCGFEDYIMGVQVVGNTQATLISCTFINSERTIDTYRGAGKILVINGRSDTALTPNKDDVVYISPILPINANIVNSLISHNLKHGNKLGNTTHYDFDYPVTNGTQLKINYSDSSEFIMKMIVASTNYPEECLFTKYSNQITKTQATFSTFSTSLDATNKIYTITFNQNARIYIKGFISNDGYIS